MVPESVLIAVEKLRVGMYIQLDIGWMNHPFPTSSFRIASPEQIEVLHGLGLSQVRYVPSRSVLEKKPVAPNVAVLPDTDVGAADTTGQPGAAPADTKLSVTVANPSGTPSVAGLPALGLVADGAGNTLRTTRQTRGEAHFEAVAALYTDVMASARGTPQLARERVESLVRADVTELMEAENYAVQLLAQVTGSRQAKHSVNVMVLAMLLGRALGLDAAQLCHLGVAGLLHDIGKMELPSHIAEPTAALTGAELELYEEHVQRSVELARHLGLDPVVVRAIGEHHEMQDGSGFPQGLQGAQASRHGQILALVNHYDRLCNPLHGERRHTPHEALARLFSQERKRFDGITVLAAFIRLMGVYPPGSVVQLDDGRFARVVASNSLSPLRPSVQPFMAGVPLVDTPVLDLSESGRGNIRRSVKFDSLSSEVLDFFAPGQQMCYFFERLPREHEPADHAFG